MIPNLGLVCITSTDEVRFKTVTKKQYLTLSHTQRFEKLNAIYFYNICMIGDALRFCKNNGINLYRLSSGLFPMNDWEDGIGQEVLHSYSAALYAKGKQAKEYGIRIVMHPDQFVVLSSTKPETVRMSIDMLKHHAEVLDMMGLPQSTWALMNIHGGRKQRIPELVSVVNDLPNNIKNRLTFENDESSYGVGDLYNVHAETGVPILYDAHHSVVMNKLDSFNHHLVRMELEMAANTWEDKTWQVVHISNGAAGFNDRSHSDYINNMPHCYRDIPFI